MPVSGDREIHTIFPIPLSWCKLSQSSPDRPITDKILPVALAWARQKYHYCYPIVGGAKVSHLEGNIAALTIKLSEDQIRELDNAVPFDYAFPLNVFGVDPRLLPEGRPQAPLVTTAAHLQF